MARKFSTSIATTHDGEVKTFVAGDTVPEWLEGKVGEHVLEPVEGNQVEEETDDEVEDAPEHEKGSSVEDVLKEEQGPAGDVDFTQPAPAKRGPGRPPKNRN